MKVLSLFDGIACGRVALERAGIPVEEYHSFEIDKYAIQTARKNYPDIIHHGDVFEGDFTKFQGFDLLIGGSPCTYWSIAKAGREITPDGIGGQLFMQYARALKESGCKYFLYENNYSIHKNIKEFISKQLGVEPIMINSALVSAQSRKRCYWTNIPNVTQPEDKGILLKDVLESGLPWQDESYCVTASYDGAVLWNALERKQRTMIAKPINQGYVTGIAEQVLGRKANEDGSYTRVFEARKDQKGNCITSTMSRNMVAEQISIPMPLNADKNGKSRTIKAQYGHTGLANAVRSDGLGATMVAEPVRIGHIGKGGQAQRIYSVRGKSVTVKANGGGGGAKTGLYKIDLPNGDYIIRKLTPIECERLQTLPDGYTGGVSNTQRYKQCGNGWTVDVIAWILGGLSNATD